MAPCVKKCQYAVRGEIYLAATERIKAGKEVIFTNVGNPHGLGQKPLTFMRQVLRLIQNEFGPSLSVKTSLMRWFALSHLCILGASPVVRRAYVANTHHARLHATALRTRF